MSVTDLAQVTDQIQKFWSPLFMDELRASLLLGGLVNKDYQGSIQNQGDEVTVSQVKAPQGETRTVGVDADSFNSQQLQTASVKVKADKVFSASFNLVSLVEIQSQIQLSSSPIRDALMYAVQEQVNKYLYSLVAPSTSAPDHEITLAALNKAGLLTVRELAAKAKWGKAAQKNILCSPEYYSDVMDETTFTSSDYVNGDPLIVGGQNAVRRMGFNIFEDDSLTSQELLAFHPDFLIWVMQQGPVWKLSDLHSQNKRGFLLSVDLLGGAKLGIEGSVKHIHATP